MEGIVGKSTRATRQAVEFTETLSNGRRFVPLVRKESLRIQQLV